MDTKVAELAFETFDFPEDLRESVKKIAENQAITIAEVCSVNFELGMWFAQAVQSLCLSYGIETSDLAFVASHGQTVYHIPQARDGFVASTLQLGEGVIIVINANILSLIALERWTWQPVGRVPRSYPTVSMFSSGLRRTPSPYKISAVLAM